MLKQFVSTQAYAKSRAKTVWVGGEVDTYDEALADVNSAIQFHIETFGEDV